MLLRNKKTGEIVEATDFNIMSDYNSLAELNEEWEDAPEKQKEYWSINELGSVVHIAHSRENTFDRARKNFGNYFETEEEAQKAVRKLEAWKILKDIGFKIEGIRYRDNKSYIEWSISQKVRDDHFTSEAFNDALHLVFGGEE